MTKKNDNSANKLEIILNFKESSVTFYLDREDDFRKLKETVKGTFGFSKISQFDIYAGQYMICEFLFTFRLDKIICSFLTNTFYIRDSPISMKGLN